MSLDALKLAVYLGERDRAQGRLLADVLMDLFAERRLATSVLLRGSEGFGIKHGVQTERLLTLSEDLPVVAIAMDQRARIEGLVEDVASASAHGVITLERAILLDGEQPAAGAGALKVTMFLGRAQRVGAVPAYIAAVDCLSRHGLDGALVLLGLDGTLGGERRRARLLARNSQTPLMLMAAGEGAAVARACSELRAMLPQASVALERVQICKRDGALVAAPTSLPDVGPDGLAHWQKLVLHTGAGQGEEPLHADLVRRLRAAGAAGATTLRGLWGFRGSQPPRGERLWSLARHAPLMTVVLDTPASTMRWFELIDELTPVSGLVTCENVPALRAGGPQIEHGGLRLATFAAEPSRASRLAENPKGAT